MPRDDAAGSAPQGTRFDTIGQCLHSLSEAVPERFDIMLDTLLQSFQKTAADARNPQAWADDRPASQQLRAASIGAVQFVLVAQTLPGLVEPPPAAPKPRNGHAVSEEEAAEHGIVFEHQSPGDGLAAVLPYIRAEDLFGQSIVATDQLVERLLEACGLSIMFGQSNSGKTFLALDLACAICRGSLWLGRYRTLQGAVVYLASEGPRSVQARIQAYQTHCGDPIPQFFIVPKPINLFDGQLDTKAIIATVRAIERDHGVIVRLIVGDTLATMSAGANENSGTDMSIVLANIERVLAALPVQFLLVHHPGKDETKGLRGWSGLKAKLDTEIEIVADAETKVHAAEFTKQRDLASKGERITFELWPIDLGSLDNFGNSVTSCIVASTDKPPPERKTNGTVHRGRKPTAPGLITGYLGNWPKGLQRWELVKHFREIDGPSKSTIYRVLDELAADGLVVCDGEVVRMKAGAK